MSFNQVPYLPSQEEYERVMMLMVEQFKASQTQIQDDMVALFDESFVIEEG